MFLKARMEAWANDTAKTIAFEKQKKRKERKKERKKETNSLDRIDSASVAHRAKAD